MKKKKKKKKKKDDDDEEEEELERVLCHKLYIVSFIEI
jgi:hypothetical protein